MAKQDTNFLTQLKANSNGYLSVASIRTPIAQESLLQVDPPMVCFLYETWCGLTHRMGFEGTDRQIHNTPWDWLIGCLLGQTKQL